MVVFTMVFGAYSVFGHIAFGGELEQFSSLALSMNTCFGILLGDIDVTEDFKVSDNGMVGFIFYYSYIVILFFVLLNVLLAILVDAYMEVKEVAEDSKTVVEEIMDVLVDGRPNPFKKGKLKLPGDKRTSQVNKFVNQMLLLIQEKEKREMKKKRDKEREARRARRQSELLESGDALAAANMAANMSGFAKEDDVDFGEHTVRKFKITKKIHVDDSVLLDMIKDQLEQVLDGVDRGEEPEGLGMLDEEYLKDMASSIVRIYGKDEEEEEVTEEDHAAEAVLAEIQELSVKQHHQAAEASRTHQLHMHEFSKKIEVVVNKGAKQKFKTAVKKQGLKEMMEKKNMAGMLASSASVLSLKNDANAAKEAGEAAETAGSVDGGEIPLQGDLGKSGTDKDRKAVSAASVPKPKPQSTWTPSAPAASSAKVAPSSAPAATKRKEAAKRGEKKSPRDKDTDSSDSSDSSSSGSSNSDSD